MDSAWVDTGPSLHRKMDAKPTVTIVVNLIKANVSPTVASLHSIGIFFLPCWSLRFSQNSPVLKTTLLPSEEEK